MEQFQELQEKVCCSRTLFFLSPILALKRKKERRKKFSYGLNETAYVIMLVKNKIAPCCPHVYSGLVQTN